MNNDKPCPADHEVMIKRANNALQGEALEPVLCPICNSWLGTIPEAKWHHANISYKDGVIQKIYIDGVEVSESEEVTIGRWFKLKDMS